MKRILCALLAVCAALSLAALAAADGLDWGLNTALPPGEYVSVNVLQPIAAELNQKMALRTGPGTNYTEWHTYPQTTPIVVFEQVMGGTVPWGMVEFRVEDGLMRAYTGMKRINASGSVPWADTASVDATVGVETTPLWGPGAGYVAHTQTLPAGTAVQVFHEESGYAMADFKFPGDKSPTRAWLPVSCLSGYQSMDRQVYVTYTPGPTMVPAPTIVPGPLFNTFDAAGNGTAFVDADGTLWMMGYNEHGEIGIGSKGGNVNAPRRVLSNVADVQLGFYFSMALDNQGDVYVWGWNKYGQAGVGSSKTQYVTSPGRIRLGNVVQIAAGDEHGVALIEDGSVYTWGRNTRGQLANGTTKDGYSPERIDVPGEVVSIQASDYNTAVILADGSLWMAGDNTCGQLCQPVSQKPCTSFVRIPLENVAQVCMGDYHAAAVTEDGSLYVWGSNEYGQVGDWQVRNATAPQFVMSGVRQVETGDYHTFALLDSGDLYAWGRNDNSQLGDGTSAHVFTPTLVQRDVWILDTGYAHTIVVKYDDSIWAVGRNKYGQLGLKDTGNITQWTPIHPIP